MINNWILHADQSEPFYLFGGRGVVRVCVWGGGSFRYLIVTSQSSVLYTVGDLWLRSLQREVTTPPGCVAFNGRQRPPK